VKKLRKLEAWLRVLSWNVEHPVGTPVFYDSWNRWPGIRAFRTRSQASVIWGDIAVVWITGHPGAVPLDQLTLAQEADAPPLQRDLTTGTLSYWLPLPPRSPRVPASLPGRVLGRKGGWESLSVTITHPPSSTLSVCKKVNNDALLSFLKWDRPKLAYCNKYDHWPSGLTRKVEEQK
jgi:hypothetical protein